MIKGRVIVLLVWLLCALGTLVDLLVMLADVFVDPQRAWLIAIADDDAGNVALNGLLGQTISSRVAHARAAGKWWGKIGCWALDGVDPGHCTRAMTDPEQNL